MRVLHAAEAFGGGLFEVVRQLALGGVRRGDAVAIAYGVRPESPPLTELSEAGIELFPVSAWTGRSALSQIGAPLELRRLVRDWSPDLVHMHSSFAGMAGAVALPRRPPTVFSPHAFASWLGTRGRAGRLLFRVAERFVVRRATVTLACGPSEARYAREVLGARSVEVVENGIEELDHPPVTLAPRSDPVVIAAGRMVSQRQPEACARILGRVADVAQVRWFGDTEGDRRESGLAALRDAGVELTGWVSRDEFLSQLAAASVYLHWTASDGQPLSILEAMAVDVPVVASDIPPCRDLLPADQICDSEDRAASLIRTIVTDDRFAERIRADQRARRGRYGARRMVDECIALYRRTIADEV